MQAAVANGQTFTTPLRLAGANEMPALMMADPSGNFRSFVLSERMERAARSKAWSSSCVGAWVVVVVVLMGNPFVLKMKRNRKKE